ncbi:MAG: hypothetical protein DMF06_05200 [Verrucomicrobia bacterium]|nr:MAG: hypothetical protein DMF06_05200 [Verrucomicrobiota bacterium]
MSFYDDYVADGLCCESCGVLISLNEVGYSRRCVACEIEERQRQREAQAAARKARLAARRESRRESRR